jgi:phage repressor protein C with HTH and peptisase S24 domain
MSTTLVDEEFRRRLRLIMQQFGSVADLARAVGVSDNAIYKWVSGRGQPSMMSLVNLSKAAGVSVEWLATGRGAPTKAKSDHHHRPPEPSDNVSMPRHVLRTANGRLAIQNQQIVDYLSFRSDWLQRVLNVDVRNIALVEVIGDSMSPTADEGDLGLVDLRESRFRHDGVYVLRTGSDLAVKRLQRQPDGSLVIRSDNSAYPPVSVKSEEVALLGRVVWIGGRL